MIKMLIATIVLSLVSAAENASAATVKAIASGNLGNYGYQHRNFVERSEGNQSASASGSISNSYDYNEEIHLRGTAEASASANASTGTLRARTEFTRTPPEWTNNASANAQASISEAFTISGSGTFSTYMLLDARWEGYADGYFSAGISASLANGVSSYDAVHVEIYRGEGSYVDRMLKAIIAVKDAEALQLNVSWQMQAYVNSWIGFNLGTYALIDASNTGKIFFETTGGLSALPSSSSFLDKPAFLEDDDPIAPVPLPASIGLFSVAIGCLATVARRRKAA